MAEKIIVKLFFCRECNKSFKTLKHHINTLHDYHVVERTYIERTLDEF